MMNKIFYYRMCAALQAVMLKSLTRDTVPAKQGRSEIRGCTTASSENSCPPCAYRLSVLPYKNTSSQHRISFTISSGRRDCENLKYHPPKVRSSRWSNRQAQRCQVRMCAGRPYKNYDDNNKQACFLAVPVQSLFCSPFRFRNLLPPTHHIHTYTEIQAGAI